MTKKFNLVRRKLFSPVDIAKHSIIVLGSCLAEPFMLNFKARCINEKRVCNSFKYSEAKILQIGRLFAVDLDASQIAQIADVNQNTGNRYLVAFREGIAHLY